MLLCIQGAPPRRNIYGSFHADFMGGIHHFSEQIKIQMRVHRPYLRRLIAITVVAFGKYGDAVYIPCAQSVLKVFLAELRANLFDTPGGMKIQIDLAPGKLKIKRLCHQFFHNAFFPPHVE